MSNRRLWWRMFMLAAVSLCAGSMTTLFLQTALQSNKDENEPQNSSSKGSARMLIAEDLEIAEDFEPSTGGAILSGVSSTWTTTTRSPPPPNQESFPGFPKCWGNPELVSECDESIDYQWSIVPDELYIPGEKADGEWWPDYELPRFDKIRILYYTKRTDYIHRAYRFFYDEIEIASTHPDLEVRMWGPGFVGYDESESLNINIKKVFDEENHFQIIYAAASGQIQGTFSKTILVYSLGDCHDMLCLEELAPNIDVLGLRYSFEAMDLFRWEQIKMYSNTWPTQNWFPLIAHLPECSLSRNFYPPSLPPSSSVANTSSLGQVWADQRPTDVQLFGQTAKYFYPLRNKVEKGIKSGQINGTIMKTRSWWQQQSNSKNNGDNSQTSPVASTPANTWNIQTLGIFKANDPETLQLQETAKEWGSGMRYTKICVFDASAERKSIRKFNEAFLSGCVVASDIPSEMEDQVFKDAVIELHQGMTEEDINDVLQEALQDLDNLQRMAVKAFKLARQHFSCKHKVDRLLEVVARYKRGEVGYWFPYGFSATCRSYSTHPGFERKDHPPWCRAPKQHILVD